LGGKPDWGGGKAKKVWGVGDKKLYLGGRKTTRKKSHDHSMVIGEKSRQTWGEPKKKKTNSNKKKKKKRGSFKTRKRNGPEGRTHEKKVQGAIGGGVPKTRKKEMHWDKKFFDIEKKKEGAEEKGNPPFVFQRQNGGANRG